MPEHPLPSGQLDFGLGTEITVVYPLTEQPPPDWRLPKFSGHKSRCPKCLSGADDTGHPKMNYHERVATYHPCYLLTLNQPDLFALIGFPEHLDRRCIACGYEWVEALPDPEDAP